MMNPCTDYFQQPLRVGDRIVYPVGLGSSGVGLGEAIIDLIEELVPTDPSDPECRYGYKYSERHKPPLARTELELPLRYGGNGTYVYDETKLFKLRVKYVSRAQPQPRDDQRTSWIKNVDRVVRAPQEVQS